LKSISLSAAGFWILAACRCCDPINVAPETVSAVSGFLAAMLQVSRDRTRQLSDGAALTEGHCFDFEATVSQADFVALRCDLSDIRDRVLSRRRAQGSGRDEEVRIHIENYLTRLDPAQWPANLGSTL